MTIMIAATDAQANPLLGLLILAGIVVFAGVFFWLFYFVIPKASSHWNELTKRFPVGDVHKTGPVFRGCGGGFGGGGSRGGNYTGTFRIEFAQEGLLVTPSFAGKSPILVPWSAIREVEEITVLIETNVIVTVEFERTVRFYMPKNAMVELQKSIPADRFRESESLFGMIKDRFNNPPK